jgi:hypothetical protein
MDTMLVTISRINRTKPDPAEHYEDEEIIQFYRQEFPVEFVNHSKPNLMREIIAVCNDLTFPKE